MTGRQVIETTEGLTLDGLLQFMQENWDKETHAGFVKGKPTPMSVEEYILLPATEHYMVIVFPRKAGGFFSRKNKVVLSVCDTAEGFKSQLATSIPTRNIFFGATQIKMVKNREEERKGPAEEILQFYTAYMKELLAAKGLC